MQLTITINLDGAAFEDNLANIELADIFSVVIERLYREGMPWQDDPWTLSDSNGNTCGTVVLEEV